MTKRFSLVCVSRTGAALCLLNPGHPCRTAARAATSAQMRKIRPPGQVASREVYAFSASRSKTPEGEKQQQQDFAKSFAGHRNQPQNGKANGPCECDPAELFSEHFERLLAGPVTRIKAARHPGHGRQTGRVNEFSGGSRRPQAAAWDKDGGALYKEPEYNRLPPPGRVQPVTSALRMSQLTAISPWPLQVAAVARRLELLKVRFAFFVVKVCAGMGNMDTIFSFLS